MVSLRRRTTPNSEIVLSDAEGSPLARIPAKVSQEMQYLWTRLEVHDGDVPRSVGLTSQLSGEGVSFVSRALAAVLARRGSTCLVEANWWGEGLPFSEENEGLVGVLLGSSIVEQELIPTGQSNLSVLPAGSLAASGGAVAFDNDAISGVLESCTGISLTPSSTSRRSPPHRSR